MNNKSDEDKIRDLLDENARMRTQLVNLAKAARDGQEYERNWLIAQQDKMRLAFEKEIRELRASEVEARSEHRESLMDNISCSRIW